MFFIISSLRASSPTCHQGSVFVATAHMRYLIIFQPELARWIVTKFTLAKCEDGSSLWNQFYKTFQLQ